MTKTDYALTRRGLLVNACALVTSLDLPALAEANPVLPDIPWLEVRLHCVVCADDDGKRKCDATPGDVQAMVSVANRIYEKARIKFVLDPVMDFTSANDTLLNWHDNTNVAPPGATVDQLLLSIYKLAHTYYGKLLVLFRYGPGASPVGNGFSGGGFTEIVLPSLRHTNAGTRMLAHEAGHYFGLPHTFKQEFRTVKAASDFLEKNGNNLDAFDGDGFSDTAPDPGLNLPFNKPVTSVVLNGISVPVPYGNIMSYMNWDGRDWMSDQQAAKARRYCEVRKRVGMSWQSNIFAPDPLEAETLQTDYEGVCAGQVQPMAGFGRKRWSGDAQLFCHASLSGSVALHFEIKQDTDADAAVYMTLAPDFGIVKFFLDGTQVGQPFDGYGPIVIPSGRVPLCKQHFTAGEHVLKVEVAGKNPQSAGTQFGIDCISLTADSSVSA
jgi:hypothetical protein